MKTIIPSVAFLFLLISFSGFSLAKDNKQFSAKCFIYNTMVVDEKSVRIIETSSTSNKLITENNEEILTYGKCSFKQVNNLEKKSSIKNQDFPEDGEQRYNIGY